MIYKRAIKLSLQNDAERCKIFLLQNLSNSTTHHQIISEIWQLLRGSEWAFYVPANVKPLSLISLLKL